MQPHRDRRDWRPKEVDELPNHESERRSDILRAAQRVFSAHGYAMARMDQVAEEAGISKGSLYNYFASKQELFEKVFEAAMAEAAAETDRLWAQEASAGEKIERLLDYWFRRLDHYEEIGRLMLEFWASAAREKRGELAATYNELYTHWRERLAKVLAEGVESGEFRSEFRTPVAASLLMGILDGIQLQSILDIKVKVDEEFLTALKRAVMAALSRNSPNDASEEGQSKNE